MSKAITQGSRVPAQLQYTSEGATPLMRMSKAITQGSRVPAQACTHQGCPTPLVGSLFAREMETGRPHAGLLGAPPHETASPGNARRGYKGPLPKKQLAHKTKLEKSCCHLVNYGQLTGT